MNDLTNRIRAAQTHAAEQVVIADLEARGLAEPDYSPVKPIEEQIVDVFQDFRNRRLRYMVSDPQSIRDEDRVPDELSRLAEARAVYLVVKADLGARKR
jgi:ribosomal protein S18 acetylase RimI-like enzyme